jgi:hypothetical protein
MPRRKKMQVTTEKETPIIVCSFCRKDRQRVGPLVSGPGVYICEACLAVSARLLTGRPTAPFAGWDALTDDEFLATLPAAASAVDAADEQLRTHVERLRERGISWERIAAALGVSRQAAWARFSGES